MPQSPFRTRGFMLDLARLTERHDYYRRFVDFAAARGANLLVLHLTDHQGCAFRFASHPELATPYAFSAEEARSFVAYCRERGVEVIPEVECFGHSGYATRKEKYRQLGEPMPDAEFSKFFAPSDPAVLAFLDDLLGEICAAFDSPWVHVGCDEVALERAPRLRGLSAEEQAGILVRHVRDLHALLARRGRRMMLWGDMLRRYPQDLDRVPRDVTVCDWDYGFDPGPEGLRLFRDRGFRVLAAPALVFGGEVVAGSERGHRNVARFARRAAEEGADGVLVTIWVPQRTIAAALWPSVAFAAAAMAEPRGLDEDAFWRNYFAERFGLAMDAGLAQTVRELWSGMPHAGDFEVFSWVEGREEGAFWRKPYLVWDHVRLARIGRRVLDDLARVRDRVTDHALEFDALILAARIACHIGARAELGLNREIAALASGAALATVSGETVAALEACIAEAREIEMLVSAYWDRDRYADDPKKATGGGWSPSQVLLTMLRAGREEAERALAAARGAVP